MKLRLLAVPILLAANFAACGGSGDDVNIESIAPGSECAEGGLRVFVNGEPFVSCNGESGDGSSGLTAEPVARGVDGNPCFNDAVRFTFNTDAGPQSAWVCKELDDSVFNEDNEAFIIVASAESPSQITIEQRELECIDPSVDPTVVLRKAELERKKLNVAAAMRCAASVYDSFDLEQDEVDSIECYASFLTLHNDCVNLTRDDEGNPVSACDGSYQSAVVDCQSAVVPPPCTAEIGGALPPTFQAIVGAIETVCHEYLSRARD